MRRNRRYHLHNSPVYTKIHYPCSHHTQGNQFHFYNIADCCKTPLVFKREYIEKGLPAKTAFWSTLVVAINSLPLSAFRMPQPKLLVLLGYALEVVVSSY